MAVSMIVKLPEPIGGFRLTAENGALVSCDWTKDRAAKAPKGTDAADLAVLEQAAAWLAAYCVSDVRSIGKLPPLAPAGTTFQSKVWEQLVRIPFGKHLSYGQLASRMASTKSGSPRAVGQAVGKNPLPVFIPCHRVLAADSALGGFSGGLDRKRALLAHEGINYSE
jgi:methylated-DNA-[protein]-cysteine S-methyltransferase